jgi:hypothetical protein
MSLLDALSKKKKKGFLRRATGRVMSSKHATG